MRLPEPLHGEVLAFADSIPEERLFCGNEDAPGGKAVESHITLKYGLTTFDEDEVARVVGSFDPFEVRMGRCGVFNNEDSIVLKIGIQSKGLVALNKRVCLLMDTVSRYREYLPHATVAYLRKDPKDPYYYRSLYDDRLEGESFWVDRLDFKTPAGNRYVVALNGSKSRVARAVCSAERVARSDARMLAEELVVGGMRKRREAGEGRRQTNAIQVAR